MDTGGDEGKSIPETNSKNLYRYRYSSSLLPLLMLGVFTVIDNIPHEWNHEEMIRVIIEETAVSKETPISEQASEESHKSNLASQESHKSNLSYEEIHESTPISEVAPVRSPRSNCSRLQSAIEAKNLGKDPVGIDGFIYPAICKKSPIFGIGNPPIPGIFSKKIALAIFRQAYRGYSGFRHSYSQEKNMLKYSWGEHAFEIQMAVLRSIKSNLMQPFLDFGYEVDVFLQTYGHSDPKINKTYMDALKKPFGDNVKGFSVFNKDEYSSSQNIGQPHCLMEVMRMLEKEILRKNETYRSVLMWRYDAVPFRRPIPRNDIEIQELKKKLAEYNECPSKKLTYFDKKKQNANEYLLWAAIHSVKAFDMYHTIPGWALPCHLGYLIDDPKYTMKDWWWNGRGTNDNLERPIMDMVGLKEAYEKINSSAWQRRSDFSESLVYRGPYGMWYHDGGKFVCRYLRHFFNGPPCGPVHMAREVKRVAEKEYSNIEEVNKTLQDFWIRVVNEDKNRAKNFRGLTHNHLLEEFGLTQPDPDESVTEEEYYRQLWVTK